MTIPIENSDVLQACVTALIGVLIFLTLERKFERKYLTSEILELKRQKNDLDSAIGKHGLECSKIDSRLKEIATQELTQADDDLEVMHLKRRKEFLESEIRHAQRHMEQLDKRIESIRSEKKLVEIQVHKYQKMKDTEDILTLTTVSLLPACIIFLIFVGTDWKSNPFDYPSLSRFLFSVGLIVLILRVSAHTRDIREDIERIKVKLG